MILGIAEASTAKKVSAPSRKFITAFCMLLIGLPFKTDAHLCLNFQIVNHAFFGSFMS